MTDQVKSYQSIVRLVSKYSSMKQPVLSYEENKYKGVST